MAITERLYYCIVFKNGEPTVAYSFCLAPNHYRAASSYNAFCARLFEVQVGSDRVWYKFFNQIDYDFFMLGHGRVFGEESVKVFEKSLIHIRTIWDLYKLIGYNYKAQNRRAHTRVNFKRAISL